jgi:Dolichyl-phosphate-mannose-protein mannosyltransferase
LRGNRGVLAFFLFFASLLALHAPLLRLPYVWDEAGYYVPAAHDIFVSGSLIPQSTVSNAHPPLVLAWVALWWRLFGTAPVVSRSAMLAVAAFALLGVYRLAKRANNAPVAVGTTLLTALYPVFFAQSSLVHLDLAAAGFTFWALRAYLDDSRFAMITWFALATLAKETAILAPAALVGWEVMGPVIFRNNNALLLFPQRSLGRVAALAASLLPLVLWFAYHDSRTGFIFGNPEFFRYNVQATLDPLRIVLAFGSRLWQTFVYMGLWAVTALTVFAMTLPAQPDGGGEERPRIPIAIQITFAVVILAYVVALSLIGGAVLSRYMLPVVPLVILIGVSTIWRRLAAWKLVLGGLAALFIAGWFWNPPYSFPFEDNLAYRDYVQLHQAAASYLEQHFAQARVLTAWTASDELNRPWLGYIHQPMRLVRIENFSADEIRTVAAANQLSGNHAPYDVILAFSTKFEAPFDITDWPPWSGFKTRFFGYHRDLPPEAIARILGGRIVMQERRRGQWIAIIAMEQPMDAELADPLRFGFAQGLAPQSLKNATKNATRTGQACDPTGVRPPTARTTTVRPRC